MKLMNVRLTDEDARLADELRVQGVSISEVVRNAIRTQARQTRVLPIGPVDDLLAEMQRQHPTPDRVARRAPRASTDRRAVQRLIRAKLRSNR
jgi:Arc/MetJ-type ribon-helix-helix transcriptional regulator